MGDDDDSSSTDEQRVEKKYCCGNCPQREAINIARLDMGLMIYGIVIISTLTVIQFVFPDYFPNYILRNPGQRFLAEFFKLSNIMQYTVLSLYLIFPSLSLCLAVLLLIGAKSKNLKTLSKWFKLSILHTIPALSIDIYMVSSFFEDKMTMVSVVVFYYLYRLYALWIVTELKKEIKHVDTDFIHPMYLDNPPC